MKNRKIILLSLVVILLFQFGCKKSTAVESKPTESIPVSTNSAASPSPDNSISPSPSTGVESASAPTAKPSASAIPPAKQQVQQSAAPSQNTALPYSQKTNSTFLHITGNGVDRDYYFSLADLQALTGGYFTADYFSRGKEPKQETNEFAGIRVDYLFDNVIKLAGGANQATFTASDGYAASYSINQTRSSFIDETVPDKTLYMILAWEQDSTSLGSSVRLVMGQTVDGEYNRLNWVRDVVTIEIKAV